MAKTNIVFNNTNYTIDDSSLSAASATLRTHLSTVMNGTGAVINLGGTSYNIDSTKLSAATNAFVSHLGTVAGGGYKVMVGGVEYGVDSGKMTRAVAEIEAVLGAFQEELGTPIYYSSLSSAIGDTTYTGDADANSAKVNVYTNTETGHKTVLLREDIMLTETLNVGDNITLWLNGYEIVSAITPAIKTTGSNVIIDGNNAGSSITVNAPVDSTATVFNVQSGKLTVNGGIYTASASGTGATAIELADGAALTITNASINSSDSNNGDAFGINAGENTTIVADGCTIEAASQTNLSVSAINSYGNVKLTNSTILGNANYTANEAGTNYASRSKGIMCYGNLELNNCYVWGAHSGINSIGALTIDGGTYEGYGHGGIYFSGDEANIRNAKINWAEMKDGYVSDEVAGTNGAGMYVGATSNANIYIDNCNFYGTLYGVVLRGSGGEENNMIYISNSDMEFGRYSFRMSSYSSRVYIGTGNGFDKNTTSLAGNCIETTESYAQP